MKKTRGKKLLKERERKERENKKIKGNARQREVSPESK